MNKQFTNDAEGVKALAEHYGAFKKEIARVIVGQDEIVSQLSLALFGGGHCLLVGEELFNFINSVVAQQFVN